MTLPLDTQPATPPKDHLWTQLFNEIHDWDKAKIVEKCIAEKLTNADKNRISEYRSTLKKALPFQTSFEILLPTLAHPNKFCGRILRDELHKTYGNRFRIQDMIKLVPKARSENSRHTCSLLQAAMLNFTDTEATADYFSADSATISEVDDAPVEGAAEVKITAQTFAALSRRLDLGNQYQTLIRQTFEVPSVQLQAIQLARLNMRLAAYNRYFSKDIHQSLLHTLTDFTAGDGDIADCAFFNNAQIQLYTVQLFGKYLVKAVLIVLRLTNESTQDRYLLYVPDDKSTTFYLDDTEENCRISLAENLLDGPSLRNVFAAQLNDRDREDFLNEKQGELNFTKDISFAPLQQGLFEYLFKQQIDKFAADVKQVVVPVAEVNQSIHGNRRNNRALNQRPPLSETLMHDFSKRLRTSTTDALLGEVFIGAEDWTYSEKLKALDTLLDLKEKPTPAGTAGQDPTAPIVSAADYFEKFEVREHSNPQKSNLLWKRDLSGYEQSSHIANRIMDQAYADDTDHRVYNFRGRCFIQVAGNLHEVEPDPLAWRIRHPLNEAAYRAPVVYSPVSGWHLQHKRAMGETQKTPAAEPAGSLPAVTPPTVL